MVSWSHALFHRFRKRCKSPHEATKRPPNGLKGPHEALYGLFSASCGLFSTLCGVFEASCGLVHLFTDFGKGARDHTRLQKGLQTA